MKRILILIVILTLTSCTTNNINNNVIGTIIIPNIINTEVVKGKDNIYYLNHDINNNENINGSIFMDYRVSINSKKVLIYGHSGNDNTLPFLKLNNYTNKDFFYKHNKIYFYTNKKKYSYTIFSSYIETKDFDYMNINNYNNLSYLEHITKLKNKSLFKTNIILNENSHILILQTCSTNKSIKSKQKYQLVIAKLD